MTVQAPLRIVFYGVHVTRLPGGRLAYPGRKAISLMPRRHYRLIPLCPICRTNRGLDAAIGRSCCLP
jgi:hypothetical protein